MDFESFILEKLQKVQQSQSTRMYKLHRLKKKILYFVLITFQKEQDSVFIPLQPKFNSSKELFQTTFH